MDTVTSMLWTGATFQWKNKNSIGEIVKVLKERIAKKCPQITHSFPQFAFLDFDRLVKANFDEHNRLKDSKQIIFSAFNTGKAAHSVTPKDHGSLQIMFATIERALDGFATITGHYAVRGQVIEAKLVLG